MTAIEGVKMTRKRIIRDQRGSVRHMLKKTDAEFVEFGEVYFSSCNANVVKGWHVHKRMTLNYYVVVGNIMVGLIDYREESQTYGNVMRVFLDDHDPILLTVPPGILNGYRVRPGHHGMAVVANCATLPHDPNEIERMPVEALEDRTGFKFDWGNYAISG